MADFGYKYIHELSQFIALVSSRINRIIDMNFNRVKNSDFMSILQSKPFKEYKKPKFTKVHRVHISKHDLLFRKVYRPHFTVEKFEIVAVATQKLSKYSIKDEIEEVKGGKLYEKEEISVS